MARDAAKVTAKQIRNAQNGAQSYVEGVQDVKDAPGKKAARKKDKYKANVNAAVDKWAENVEAVSLDEWQRAASGKGAERFAPGIEAARDKISAFHAEFQPFVAQVKAELDAMPDATPEQRKQKMLANVEKMSKFKRSRRRR